MSYESTHAPMKRDTSCDLKRHTKRPDTMGYVGLKTRAPNASSNSSSLLYVQTCVVMPRFSRCENRIFERTSQPAQPASPGENVPTKQAVQHSSV